MSELAVLVMSLAMLAGGLVLVWRLRVQEREWKLSDHLHTKRMAYRRATDEQETKL